MLDVNNLNVRYCKIEALSSMYLESNEGEMVSIIGRNSSGKSTILKTIFGLVPVADGENKFFDEQINGIRVYLIVALRIAHGQEGRGIFGRMNVRENLQLGATVTKDNE